MKMFYHILAIGIIKHCKNTTNFEFSAVNFGKISEIIPNKGFYCCYMLIYGIKNLKGYANIIYISVQKASSLTSERNLQTLRV